MTKTKIKRSNVKSLETWMMLHGKKKDVFFTPKSDAHMTGSATYYKRIIKTERMYNFSQSNAVGKITKITKVTILK